MKWRSLLLRALALTAVVTCVGTADGILFYTLKPSNGAGQRTYFGGVRQVNPADVAVPPGYCIEPVVTGLNYPTAAITDEEDRVYIVEAGYSYGEDFAQARL